MNEKIITLDSVEPVEIYGVNDVKLNIIQKHQSLLKLNLAIQYYRPNVSPSG